MSLTQQSILSLTPSLHCFLLLCHLSDLLFFLGLYNRQQCPKGKHCNFLHVFENPGGAFSILDSDHLRTSPGRRLYPRRCSRHSEDLRDRSQSPSHSPSHRDHARSERDRGRGRTRHRSYSPYRRRSHYSRSPDSKQWEEPGRSGYSRRLRRDGQSYPDRERSLSPHHRSRSPRKRRRKHSSYRGSDSHSPEEKCSPERKNRHKRQSKRRREDDSPSGSSLNSLSPSQRSLSRSPPRRYASPSEGKRHNRKRKSKKSKHSHHHKKHKRRRDDGGEEEVMKETMDEMLRDIIVDDDDERG